MQKADKPMEKNIDSMQREPSCVVYMHKFSECSIFYENHNNGKDNG